MPLSREDISLPNVVYVGGDGEKRTVDALLGESVMSAALRMGVPGIIGECGGNTSCATCHVVVLDDFLDAVGEPGELESDLLDLGVSCRRAGSRLGCQIKITDALDGLTVEVPPDQS